MRKLLLTLLILTFLPLNLSFGQNVQEKSLLILGVNYDEGLSVDIGWGGTLTDNVVGGRLYGFGRIKFGETAVETTDSLTNFANAALEVAVIWPAGKFYYGLLLNPAKVDWLQIDPNDWNTYLTNAFGVVVGMNINDRVSVTLDGKLNNGWSESLFPGGVSVGGHAAIKLGDKPQTAGLN